MHTLADTVGALDALLPSALFTPQAAGRLRCHAARIPSALAAAYGFECRLTGDDRVDLLYCVNPDRASALAETEPVLRHFAGAWPVCVPDVWLEHDLDEQHDAPSVFFHLDSATADDVVGLSRLIGVPMEAGEAAFVTRILETLPQHGALDQVGWMLSRPGAALRCVVRLVAADVPRWLRQVGWPGDVAAVAPALDFLASHCDYLVIDLDVGSPSLGIEAHYNQRRQPRHEPRWQSLLDGLVAAGACQPDKRDALLALPRSAADPSVLLTDCILLLSHVKMSVPHGGVKAYLGFLRVRRC